MQALRSQLLKDPSSVRVDAHKGSETGSGKAYYARRVHPSIVSKITEIVAEGIIDIQTVKSMLRHYVLHKLCKDNPPQL